MKSFSDWMLGQVTTLPELPDWIYEYENEKGRTILTANCRSCGRCYTLDVDRREAVDMTDSYYNVCGGGPACIP